MIWLHILSGVLGFSAPAHAAPVCTDAQVQQAYKDIADDAGLRVPDFKDLSSPPAKQNFSVPIQIENQKLNLKFVKFPAQPPKLGTVVFLCGGPTKCTGFRSKAIPPNYDIVTFDPIGLGMNASASLTPEAKSDESQAKAVEAIVQKMQLKNYVLAGQSFGTASATLAAPRLTNNPRVAPPKAVVLEGVFGPRKNGYRDFSGTATRAWELLSPSDREAFVAAYDDFKKQNPSMAKGAENALGNALNDGPIGLAHSLRDLGQAPMSDWKNWVMRSAAVDQKNVDSSHEGGDMYLAAGCQTIRHVQDPSHGSADSLFDPRLNFGISDIESKVCGCRTVSRDFDPCASQISQPIIYINGDHDPLTPIEGARKHYDCQKNMKKVFLTAKDGGHVPTYPWSGTQANSCIGQIYDAAFAGAPNDLDASRDLSKGCEQGSAPAAARAKTSR